MNTLTIAGNCTRDPELKYTASGAAVAKFGVAVERRRKKGDEWETETSFVDVTCWREMAENVSESLAKGVRVVVSGRLEQREWEGRDGNKRTAVELVADEVGASLRWATAEVTRNERRAPKPESKPANDYGEEPW